MKLLNLYYQALKKFKLRMNNSNLKKQKTASQRKGKIQIILLIKVLLIPATQVPTQKKILKSKRRQSRKIQRTKKGKTILI